MKSLFLSFALIASPLMAAENCHIEHDSMELSLNSIQSYKIYSENKHIDLMAFYQPSYAKLKGEEWVHNRIQYLVERANIVLENSGVASRIRLVNAQPVTGIADDLPYKSSYDNDGNLVKEGAGRIFSARVLNPYEGYPEATVYNDFGADLAVYFRDFRVDEDEVLGLASQGRELSVVFDKKVTDESFLLGDLTLIHEIGHNLDAGHEIGADDVNSSHADAHAYSCSGKNTIMWSTSSENMHEFFSDPNKLIDNDVCGVDGDANNFNVINNNILLAANRREAPVSSGSVFFSKTDYSVNESDGLVRITIKRDGDLSKSASVQVALVSDTANSNEDFISNAQRIIFSEDSDTAYYEFELIDDVLDEGIETANLVMRYPFKLELSSTPEAKLSIVESDVSGEIGDIVVLQPEDVVEGDSVKVTLERQNGSDGELLVSIKTVDGNAKSSLDYTAFDEIIKFADGEIKKEITISTLDDENKEFDEDFNLSVSSEMDVNIINPNVTIKILDNDEEEHSVGQLSLDSETLNVSESVGKVTVVINRVNGSVGELEAKISTVNGGQHAGRDFVQLNENIVFADGETSKTVDIEIIDDSNVEGGDTSFYVVLDSVTAEVLNGELKITVEDNDVSEKPVDPPVIDKGAESSGGSFGFYLFALIGMLLITKKTSRTPLNANKYIV